MPFVAINCGALPETLIESELFGHRKGAFTGADDHRVGLFEVAHGGTIFLDEIGELPKAMQAKLLRVLESGEIRRVGENKPVMVDVRVVCATHRNLPEMVAGEDFREDLMYRINTFEIMLPALRERIEDMPELARHLLVRHRRGKDADAGIAEDAIIALCSHVWPGNVRELANVIEHATILCDSGPIRREHLPSRFDSPATRRRRPPEAGRDDAPRPGNGSDPRRPRTPRRQQAEGGRRTRHQPEDALQQAESDGHAGEVGVTDVVNNPHPRAGPSRPRRKKKRPSPKSDGRSRCYNSISKVGLSPTTTDQANRPDASRAEQSQRRRLRHAGDVEAERLAVPTGRGVGRSARRDDAVSCLPAADVVDVARGVERHVAARDDVGSPCRRPSRLARSGMPSTSGTTATSPLRSTRGQPLLVRRNRDAQHVAQNVGDRRIVEAAYAAGVSES